jgi:hypothetical protein
MGCRAAIPVRMVRLWQAAGWAGTPALPVWGVYPWEPRTKVVSYALSCPARAAARGGRAPCTPGPGRCPWEPQFDVVTCRASGAHASGQFNTAKCKPYLGTPEACADAIITWQASHAGGLGGGAPARIPHYSAASEAGERGRRAPQRIVRAPVTPLLYGRVRISGPLSVITIECSNWAESEPSAVRTVQPSFLSSTVS